MKRSIRSRREADDFAATLDEELGDGETVDINFIRIRKENGYLMAIGQAHRCNEGEQRYTWPEFAEFVVWPERKRINDWLRHKNPEAWPRWPAAPKDGAYQIGDAAFLVTPTGGIVWSNAWNRIDDFVKAGFVAAVGRGPETMGHVDFVITDRAAEYKVDPQAVYDILETGRRTRAVFKAAEYDDPRLAYNILTDRPSLDQVIEDALDAKAGDNPPAARLGWIHEYAVAGLVALREGNVDQVARRLASIAVQARRYGVKGIESLAVTG